MAFSEFNKLHTFSIAAKHLSFSIAAEELNITQAAVSQQIRSLEEKLGFFLFHRITRGLLLTEEGKTLAQTSQKVFEEIHQTIDNLTQDELSGVLTVSTLPSLAMKWLIPRLEKFSELYPDLNVHIHSHEETANFKSDGVDMALRFGYTYAPDHSLYSSYVMDEDIFLVASPELLKTRPCENITDLKRHTLLTDEIDCHFEAYGLHKEVTWDAFSTLLDIDLGRNKTLIITGAHLVLQAAIQGQGIAISRSALAEEELQSGRLVKLFDDKATIASPGYHVVYPKTSAHRKKIQVFEAWLKTQVSPPST